MSKAQTLTISVNPTDNNCTAAYIISQRSGGFVSSNTWPDISAGTGTNVALSVTNRNAGALNPSNVGTFFSARATFNTTFGNKFDITRTLVIVDVSDINSDAEFLPKTMNLFSGNIFKPSNTNIASDHSIILAKPSAALFDEIQLAGIGYTGATGDFLRIEGWTAQQDNSSAITPYSEEFDLGAHLATHNSGRVRAGMTFTLTKQAKQDIFNNDFFCFWILDFDYDVRYRSPQTESPSPGARSFASAGGLFMIDGQDSSGTPVEGVKVNYLQGGIKPTSVTKERIEDDFTINSFADITDQRGRLNVNGFISDQIPFLLGVKGPLSLRGRQFTNDGKPISSTVDPPRTIKNSKD